MIVSQAFAWRPLGSTAATTDPTNDTHENDEMPMMSTSQFFANSRCLVLAGLVAAGSVCGGPLLAADISALNQHFNDPGKTISPWMFVPKSNIKEFSTEEHPGLATIYEAGKGHDIKGILEKPIKIGDYRLPWEFQTSLVQSFNLTAGVGVKTQVNAAIGLNVAVTFSDPSTWPSDRTKRPPKTHDFQLLDVHLGSTGEAGIGLPQFSTEPHPETYLVWGRGDLGHTVMGDWRIPYVWIGDGAKYAGPASPQLFFRCVVLSPTALAVGIKFEASHGWNMRTIDCSEYGKITGVWEIGPIISADRWIPDVLCRNLPQVKGPHPLFLGNGALANGRRSIAPKPEPPNPKYEYYVDYCVFFGSSPRPFEKFSDEFNILGYLGQWQVQEQCTLMDTHSHPGYLMLKLLGPGPGDRIRGGGRLVAEAFRLSAPLGDRDELHRSRRLGPLELLDELHRVRQAGPRTRHVDARRRERSQGEAAPAIPRRNFQAPFRSRGARVDPGAQAAGNVDPVHRRLARPAGFPRDAERPVVSLRDLRREEGPGHRDRRIRHALLEHDHRPHLGQPTRRPDVSEVPDRLRPLSLRALHASGRRRWAEESAVRFPGQIVRPDAR